MKKFPYAFVLLVVAAGLVVALSVPLSSGVGQYQKATVLESIQRQIQEIAAAIEQIQLRIAELLLGTIIVPEPQEEQFEEAPAVLPEESQEDLAETYDVVVRTPEIGTDAVVSAKPMWEFVSLPSTFLSEGLAILYRFSVTAGSEDETIPSVAYTITYADITIKDLEVFAFTDDLFYTKAYGINPVGKRNGIMPSGETAVLLISDKTTSLVIPAGETRYFELRGITTGKNIAAIATISAEGMEDVVLE